MSKWLARLKNQKAPDTHATKPTEPGFVGFVACLPGTLEISRVSAAPAVTVQDWPTPPANDPTATPATASRPAIASCATCSHRTQARTCGDPEAAGLADRFRVIWLDLIGNHGATCKAHQAREEHPPYEELPRLTAAQQRAVIGWSDAEIAEAGRYMRQADRHGFDLDLSERITDHLMLRDRQGDDRRMCLECSQLDRSGRCSVARSGRLPGAGRDLQPVKVALIRCPGFNPNSRN